MPACNFLNMETIHLQQTLPQVFADRNSITSDIWHKNIIFRKGEMYLIEAASGTGNHHYVVIYMAIEAIIKVL